jgi:hypothetical protein
VVRRVFDRMSRGMSALAIAKMLDSEGVLTPSNSRDKGFKGSRGSPVASICRMIRDERNKGEETAQRYRVERKNGKTFTYIRPESERVKLSAGVTPPIVDELTWARTNEVLTRRSADYTHNQKRQFRLRQTCDRLCGRLERRGMAVGAQAERTGDLRGSSPRARRAYHRRSPAA